MKVKCISNDGYCMISIGSTYFVEKQVMAKYKDSYNYNELRGQELLHYKIANRSHLYPHFVFTKLVIPINAKTKVL